MAVPSSSGERMWRQSLSRTRSFEHFESSGSFLVHLRTRLALLCALESFRPGEVNKEEIKADSIASPYRRKS
jgi:hypothetical protein